MDVTNGKDELEQTVGSHGTYIQSVYEDALFLDSTMLLSRDAMECETDPNVLEHFLPNKNSMSNIHNNEIDGGYVKLSIV